MRVYGSGSVLLAKIPEEICSDINSLVLDVYQIISHGNSVCMPSRSLKLFRS